LPAENALHSATAYEIAPLALFALFRRMREEKLEHLGIYHSHPQTDNAPSPRDIAEACYPQTPYFIVSPRAGFANPVRAFIISNGRVQELVLEAL
jgi:proteasome lid subunit RPN8/RPN11